MKILHRYILKEFARFFAITLSAFGGCHGGTGTSDVSPKRATESREGQLAPHQWACGLAFGHSGSRIRSHRIGKSDQPKVGEGECMLAIGKLPRLEA